MAKVLVVDDIADNVKLLSYELGDSGHEPIGAADGIEALELAASEHPDAILLDIMMPGIDGIEVCRRLKADPSTRAIPVLMVTAIDTDEEIIRGLDAGAEDYITKPFHFPVVLARLRAALRAKADQDQLVEVNRQLTESRARAELSSRAKSTFLTNLSHEVRTPLNAVLGVSQILLDSELPPQHRQLVRTIQDSGQSLLTLINDILSLSRIDGGVDRLEMRPFAVRECVEVALEAFSVAAAGRGIELICDADEDVSAEVLGDGARVRQVVLNLVGNAVKFSDRGEVVVSIGREEGPMLRFSVRDEGIGIAADRVDSLFQPFTQLDDSDGRLHGGAGLGLAICRRLVESMGGSIGVESAPGAGSTFSFSVPLPGVAGGPPARGGKALGLRLLIVVPSPALRKALGGIAEGAGMFVVAARSTAEALAILDRGSDPFDAIAMDGHALGGDLGPFLHELKGRPAAWGARHVTLLGPTDSPFSADDRAGVTLAKPVRRADWLAALGTGGVSAPAPRREGEKPGRFDAELGRACPLRILIVEDSLLNQRMLSMILGRLGYSAKVAEGSHQALRALEAESFDLLLTDIQMPGMTGIELAGAIRALGAALRQPRIVAVTANALNEARLQALDAGMDDYLTKPVMVEPLARVLRETYDWSIARGGGADLGEPAGGLGVADPCCDL